MEIIRCGAPWNSLGQLISYNPTTTSKLTVSFNIIVSFYSINICLWNSRTKKVSHEIMVGSQDLIGIQGFHVFVEYDF